MIRIDLGEEVSPSVWAWRCAVEALEGRSRQPLLDACRMLKSLGADPAVRIGAFWPGCSEPALTCTIGAGAALTVSETDRGGPYLIPWKPFRRPVR